MRKLTHMEKLGDFLSDFEIDKDAIREEKLAEEKRNEWHRQRTDDNQTPNYQKLINHEQLKLDNGQNSKNGIDKYFHRMFVDFPDKKKD